LCSIAVVASACLSTDAESAGVNDSVILNSIDGSTLAALMQKEGYAAEADSDGDVKWKLEGLKSQLIVSPAKTSIQFHIAFASSNVTLQKVNAWNMTKRFSRTYLDAKGNPHLALDLELAGGITAARLIDFLKTCKVSTAAWVDEVLR
jgi:hypothetical protein